MELHRRVHAVNTRRVWVRIPLLSCYRVVPANDVIVPNENSAAARSFPSLGRYAAVGRSISRSLNLGNRFNLSLEGSRVLN